MTNQLTDFDYADARRAMVESQLRPQGVSDPLIVEAMGSVPRERFVPEGSRSLAYLDRPVPVGEGRSLAPPAATGLLLTAMALAPGSKVLVLGSGTGYSAAVLAAAGMEVTAVEPSAVLRQIGAAEGVGAVDGPLDRGLADNGLYDAILIDGAIPQVPRPIIDQLKDGGTIGYASLDRGVSRLTVGRKSGGLLGLRSIADVAVAPLPAFNRPWTFSF